MLPLNDHIEWRDLRTLALEINIQRLRKLDMIACKIVKTVSTSFDR